MGLIMSDEQYCLNAYMRVQGYTCERCGKRGSDRCRSICINVKKMI